jgi:adenylyltransferase/sulfurtransferase
LKDFNYSCHLSAPEDGPSSIEEVSVQELQRILQSQSPGAIVLDVRERPEAAIANIPGARLLPLSEMTSWVSSLNPDETYLINCKLGRRSIQAAEFLRQRGFRSVKSVRGGILAWAEEIDRSVPKY